MSILQDSKVNTLSDPNFGRNAQWADQAILGRPAGSASRSDIDGVSGESRNAVAGAHGSDAFLFVDLQAQGFPTRGVRNPQNHSSSKTKRRVGTHTSATKRDSFTAAGQPQRGEEKGRKTLRSAAQSATPSVMIAELPFAIQALQEDAEQPQLIRLPDARPYRGMQRTRRSSLPNLPVGNAPVARRVLALQSDEGHGAKGLPDLQYLATCETGVSLSSRDAAQGAPNAHDTATSIYQRLSQLLAKPEVGGYLVMGTLIACSFFV